MWPFNRRQDQDIDSTISELPEEVQEYYEAEKREHLGVAWLLAFVTLIVTVGIVVGLFFPGRWAYRKITGNDSDKPSTTQTATNKDQTESQTSGSKDQETKTTPPSSAGQTPATTPPATANQPTASAPTQPVTGQTLANTGPTNNLVIFAAVSLLAALGHNFYQRRKLNP